MSEVIEMFPGKKTQDNRNTTSDKTMPVRILKIQDKVWLSNGSTGARIQVSCCWSTEEVIAFHPFEPDHYIGDELSVGACIEGCFSWERGRDQMSALLQGKTIDPAVYGPVLIPRHLAACPGDLEELVRCVEGVQTPEVRTFLNGVFADPDIYPGFVTVPSSLLYHHNWRGGTLAHSLETVDIALRTGAYENQVEKDLLVGGCLLHDVGKVRTYTDDGKYQEEGRIAHHDQSTGEVLAAHLRVLGKQNASYANMMRHLLYRKNGYGQYPDSVLRRALFLADGISGGKNMNQQAFAYAPDCYSRARDQNGKWWVRPIHSN